MLILWKNIVGSLYCRCIITGGLLWNSYLCSSHWQAIQRTILTPDWDLSPFAMFLNVCSYLNTFHHKFPLLYPKVTNPKLVSCGKTEIWPCTCILRRVERRLYFITLSVSSGIVCLMVLSSILIFQRMNLHLLVYILQESFLLVELFILLLKLDL